MNRPDGEKPVRDTILPYGRQWIDEEDIQAVVDVLRGDWLTTGPAVERFEKEFARRVGAAYAVAVSNGTAALHCAVYAAGIGEGDEVIVPAITFAATANAVVFQGGTPVFADVEPDTLLISVESVEKLITPRTQAIIAVDYAGQPAAYDELRLLARRRRLLLIADACHAVGGEYRGQPVGTLGDMSCFSFHPVKNITTGEGGMIVTRDPGIAARCRTMRLHGISHDAFDRYTSTKPAWFYEVVALGCKYNMTDIAASLGIHQLKKAWTFQKRRQQLAARYDEAFADLPVILPPRALAGDTHARHLYVLRMSLQAPISRDRFIERMAEAGIGCSVHFIPLHLHPYWRKRYALQPEDFPHSFASYEASVSLPLYTRMRLQDQERVIDEVRGMLA